MENILLEINNIRKRKENIEQLIKSISNEPISNEYFNKIGIDNNTYISKNIERIVKTPALMNNYEIIKCKTIKGTKTHELTIEKYNKTKLLTNMITRAFNETNDYNDVYLVVYGDFRYFGGGVTTIPTYESMPTTQEEQIFIRTNVAKSFYDNKEYLFKKGEIDFDNNFNELNNVLINPGYWLNNERHIFFNQTTSNFLRYGNILLIKDIYQMRDRLGNTHETPNKKINLLYVVAPMYIHKTQYSEKTDEDIKGDECELNKYGNQKIETYKTTINNILNVELSDNNKKKVLIVGDIGVGVYLDGQKKKTKTKKKTTAMGLTNINCIKYVREKYSEYLENKIKEKTSFDKIIYIGTLLKE